jgi:hypothetical protein
MNDTHSGVKPEAPLLLIGGGERASKASEFNNPSQVEAPYGVAGLLYAIGYYLREPVLIVYAEQEADFCGQPYRKGVTKVGSFEIVGGTATYLDGLGTAVGIFYFAADQCAAIES